MEDHAAEDHGLVRLDLKLTTLFGGFTIEEVQVDKYNDAIILPGEVYRVIHGISSTINEESRDPQADFRAVGFETRDPIRYAPLKRDGRATSLGNGLFKLRYMQTSLLV